MAAIYQWEHLDLQVLTTTLYPIEVVEGLAFSLSFQLGYMRQIPDDHMIVFGDAVSGTVVQVLLTTGPYDDHVILEADMLLGSVVQVLLETGPYDDHMIVEADMLSGLVKNGLVKVFMPDEGLIFALELVSGSMTSV